MGHQHLNMLAESSMISTLWNATWKDVDGRGDDQVYPCYIKQFNDEMVQVRWIGEKSESIIKISNLRNKIKFKVKFN